MRCCGWYVRTKGSHVSGKKKVGQCVFKGWGNRSSLGLGLGLQEL